MNSKIKGITDDITSIPPEEQRYYALNAFPKVLKIGRFNLNEEFIKGFLNDIMKKADKTYVNDELEKKADKEYVDTELAKKADISFVNEEIKQSEVYFTPPFLNFMKSSDKTFEDIEWLCFDGVTMYLFYTGGVLYYFKTNDFKNYESFTPSVLNPDTREPIINPRIFYVEYNNGKFMGM
ncbi:hypothetical protein TVAGG3_0827540, partial [Trichomonas vaginalis G3]|uniref:hypothetical protein n=1 Tax=Trichomonas vaginalis (strain ATCC PRA-98 / G3) TaxID=412133 RepID=UPI0021E5FD03